MKELFKYTCCLAFAGLFFFSCTNDDMPDPQSTDCSLKALYRGTYVCHLGENSAGLEFESDGSFIILTNFFEMVDSSSIAYDDVLFIEYENVDSTLYNSGALCGALIVAPVAELSCVEY